MGVQFKSIVQGKDISLKELSGKVLAVDAFNWIFQFLTTIRLSDGSLLTDSSGKVTSHLNGLFHRSVNLLANNITPWFVFDGKFPKFKKKTVLEREATKKEAEQLAVAAETQEERTMYLKRTARVDDYIINSSKELLSLMGIPVLQAPAEGEAQASRLNMDGLCYAVASQDYDALLFGANRMIRNLNVTNRKKVVNKGITVEVKPQLLESKKLLEELGITREGLVLVAMFIGTDYNTGVKGIGPKKGLSIVKKEGVDKILNSYDFGADYPAREVFDYFFNPAVERVKEKPQLSNINSEGLMDFLSKQHSFEESRITSALSKINTKDSSLNGY